MALENGRPPVWRASAASSRSRSAISAARDYPGDPLDWPTELVERALEEHWSGRFGRLQEIEWQLRPLDLDGVTMTAEEIEAALKKRVSRTMTRTITLSDASDTLFKLIEIRQQYAGEDFETARRAVFADPRYRVWTNAYRADDRPLGEVTLATRGERAMIRDTAARVARCETTATYPDDPRAVEEIILTRAKQIISNRGGELRDAIRDVLAADQPLAEAYTKAA